MPSRFLQFHTLTHYSASLLNRDDAGFSKRMPFGGAVRTRISSQCLKRHWRVFNGENDLRSIAAPESVRSRISFERFVVEPLVRGGANEEAVRLATDKLIGKLLGGDAKREKGDKKAKKDSGETSSPGPVAKTDQVTVLGRPELDYLRTLVEEVIGATDGDPTRVTKEVERRLSDKSLKENLQALAPGSLEAGLGAALFGRMVTGDILSRTDAAIHVAHAMTVHGQMTETDYFTAIDDLVGDDGEQGSGHINASELTSGLFYGYVVVDVPGLVANLGGDRQLAADVVERLVHMMATVSPGAKKGSTAPYAYSDLVLVESGNAQPRTLQNAFVEPVPTRGDVVQNAYTVMHAHVSALDAMYGKPRRAHAALKSKGIFDAFSEDKVSLGGVAAWAKAQVQ